MSKFLNSSCEKDKQKHESDEYVTVKGFKRTDKNMCGMNNFQYELGKIYELDEEPETCIRGFHFSLSIKDVYSSGYALLSSPRNRFFEVEALVKKKDLDSYGRYTVFCLNSTIVTQLAAKKITLIRELTNEELFETYSLKNHPLITLEDFLRAIKSTLSEKDFFTIKVTNLLEKYGYSHTFTQLLTLHKESKDLLDIAQKAIALKDEGISTDMRIFLLLNGK